MLISSLQDQWTIQEGCLKVMYSLKVYISEVSLSSSRIKTNRDERESQSWQCPPRVFPIYGILPPGSQKENIAKLWKNQKITQFTPPPQDLEMGGGQQIMQIIHCYFPHPSVFFFRSIWGNLLDRYLSFHCEFTIMLSFLFRKLI